MSQFCSFHQFPRFGLNRIDSHAAAVSLLDLIIDDPMRAETFVVFLDDRHCGSRILAVPGTIPFDALFDVLEVVVSHIAASEVDVDVDAIVVASVRPPAPGVPDLDSGDVDRWLEASAMLDDVGIELLEWFVVGHGVSCPRDELGEPPRWRRSAA